MDYKYQLSTDITLSYLLSEYEKYTFPNLRDKMRTMDIIDPLLAILVKSEDIMVGLTNAEFCIQKDWTSCQFRSTCDAINKETKTILITYFGNIPNNLSMIL